MNRKLTLTLLLGVILVAVGLPGAAFAKETSKSDKEYTIPAELKPIWTWKNGYTDEETLYFRRAYTGEAAQLQDDIGLYASRHLTEILPCATVHRDGPVAMLESAPMPEIADVVATTPLGTMTLGEMMKDPRARFKGIAVVHKGKQVFERYIGIRPWENNLWASSSKTIPGLLAHQMAEEGLLDLSAPVSAYLTELKGTAWEKVPVEAVLHQRSGLDVGEGGLGKPGHPTTLFYAIMTGATGVPKDASLMDAVKKAVKIAEPGKVFEYASINTFVLGRTLEKVSGKPVHDLITERIWSKAGMEGDALLTLSPSGEPSIHGLFGSRLRDMARYGILYTPSWNVVAKERVVSGNYLSKVYAASRPEIFPGNNLGNRMIQGFGNIGMGESYQWDAVFPDGDIYKSGRNGQCLYISPETDTVVVWFSSVYNNTLWVHSYAREIVKQMFREQALKAPGKEGVTDTQQNDKASVFAIKDTIKGFSAEDSRRFKQEFGVASSLTANPTAAWFHNYTSRALPTAVIPRRQPVMPLQAKIIPEIGKVTATTRFGEMDLNAFLNHPESFAQGFIVVHKGKIVFEQYPGMREADSHLTASTAKVLVGLLVERLIEEGLIDEQKTIGDYVPEFRDSVWAPIKVIDVMDMTTGLDPIDGPEHFANPDAVVTRMVMAELGEPYKGKLESMSTVMKEAKPVSKPGEHFTYSSTATQALVILTEAVTRQAWADAFDQRIWSKMGVEGALQVHLSPEGYALGHGVLSLRLRDLARFGMLYTPSWDKIAVEPVVTPKILERARAPYRSREFYRAGPSGKKFMERLDNFDVRSAGRQWDAVWDDGDFFKSGLNTQGIYVSPDRDLVIAYFSLEPTQQLQKYLRPLVTSDFFAR